MGEETVECLFYSAEEVRVMLGLGKTKKIKSPVYTEDEYRMALSNYRKVDITKQNGKRKIIDTFINAVYMYDDRMKIIYNGKNKEECISMDALENSSTLFSFGAPDLRSAIRNELPTAFMSPSRQEKSPG